MRNRRGAILVLVAVVMVSLMGCLLIVLDMSKMGTQKNMMQTAADAAALAAVIELLDDTTTVGSEAAKYSSANKVYNRQIAVASADVVCGRWNDNTGVFTASVKCGAGDDAVTVTVRDTVSYTSRFLNPPSKNLTATARAWLAYVGSTSCVTPWGIPYQTLTKKLDPGNTDTLRALTSYDLQQLRTLPAASLRFRLTAGGDLGPDRVAGILMPGQTGGSQLTGNNPADPACYPGIGPGTVLNVDTGNEGFNAGSDFTGRAVTAVLYKTIAGQPQKVTIWGLVTFWIEGIQDNDAISHFLPSAIGGVISPTPSAVRRPILVQ